MAALQRRQLVGLGMLAGLVALGAAILNTSAPTPDAGALAVPAGGEVSGPLRAFDARTVQAGCGDTEAGPATGTARLGYDAASRSLTYTLTLTDAAPNTDYLLDVSECAAGGQPVAH